MSRIIAVLSELPHLYTYIRSELPNLTITNVVPNQSDTLQQLSTAEILVADCNLLIPYIYQLPKVKWIQTTWAGMDKLTPHIQNKKLNCQLTRFSDESFGLAMSEYVIAHIFNLERDQRRQYENQKHSSWQQTDRIKTHRLITDLSIGILGLGNIGKCIAHKLKLFGGVVWGVSRSLPREKLEYVDEHRTTDDLSIVLKNCDYIINVLPSTKDTVGLLNGDILKNCQEKSSVFINVGRGTIVKESDLINALENRWISAAILDVFEEEPLPLTSRLWTLPQVTISPHISGVSRPKSMAKFFAENYSKYIKGESLKNIFDPEKDY